MHNTLKKILISILILPLILLYTGCGDDGDGVTYTVSFYAGTTETRYTEFELEKGKKIPLPQEPTLEGHIFLGWYSDIERTNKWDFSKDTIDGHTKLFAKWEKPENTGGENTPSEPNTPPTE